MKISKQNRRDAKSLFRSCLANGVLDSARVLQAVDAVLAQKPRGYLPVLSHFTRLVKLDEARRAATVESAVPLEPAFQEQVKANLGRIYGPGLNVSFAPNPALIGGLRVQVGSDVYDSSVQARLNQLKDSL